MGKVTHALVSIGRLVWRDDTGGGGGEGWVEMVVMAFAVGVEEEQQEKKG